MESKLEKIKLNLIQQYSKLEGLTEQKLISKLDKIDWSIEFKKFKKYLRLIKIFQGLFAALIIIMAVAIINEAITAQSALVIFCMMFSFISGLQRIHSKNNSKLRVLGLLYEIYN